MIALLSLKRDALTCVGNGCPPLRAVYSRLIASLVASIGRDVDATRLRVVVGSTWLRVVVIARGLHHVTAVFHVARLIRIAIGPLCIRAVRSDPDAGLWWVNPDFSVQSR